MSWRPRRLGKYPITGARMIILAALQWNAATPLGVTPASAAGVCSVRTERTLVLAQPVVYSKAPLVRNSMSFYVALALPSGNSGPNRGRAKSTVTFYGLAVCRYNPHATSQTDKSFTTNEPFYGYRARRKAKYSSWQLAKLRRSSAPLLHCQARPRHPTPILRFVPETPVNKERPIGLGRT
ncbi:hypothetical protein Purlil1_14035 [Purpureocillium lilacinum]|uniref:Secreted protein n=1 Tax=Purpureocillium lilacinum TaxID=33203 RepID=A0ABR0BCF2_PURLI|nr:hypothetical protein Purlil1_14035 [Purpureocillium lilacinum]